VAFGGQPAWVPENLINAIRRRVEQINLAGGESLAGLQPGDQVVIREGPFAGYQAIFDARLSGDERVRVLLSLLSRQQLPLELPGAYIAPQKQS
jgi:transcriptional antiterminator RfaH